MKLHHAFAFGIITASSLELLAGLDYAAPVLIFAMVGMLVAERAAVALAEVRA